MNMSSKLKTITLSAAMLLGMCMMVVPQAMAGDSVFATYKLPLGLQFDQPVTAKMKPYLKFSGDVFVASSMNSRDINTEAMKGYLRKSLGVQTLNGGVVSVLFFDGRYPKVMRGLLSKGMSAEKLKKLLQKQGGKEIVIPSGKYRYGFITAVFGSYQYAFRVIKDDDDEKKQGLQTMEIMEYLDY